MPKIGTSTRAPCDETPIEVQKHCTFRYLFLSETPGFHPFHIFSTSPVETSASTTRFSQSATATNLPAGLAQIPAPSRFESASSKLVRTEMARGRVSRFTDSAWFQPHPARLRTAP